jgi:hypothetical protein
VLLESAPDESGVPTRLPFENWCRGRNGVKFPVPDDELSSSLLLLIKVIDDLESKKNSEI